MSHSREMAELERAPTLLAQTRSYHIKYRKSRASPLQGPADLPFFTSEVTQNVQGWVAGFKDGLTEATAGGIGQDALLGFSGKNLRSW